jgi:hypothetical protein
MLNIKEDELQEIKTGEYPAIEALTFAVIEMRKYVENQENVPLGPANYTKKRENSDEGFQESWTKAEWNVFEVNYE